MLVFLLFIIASLSFPASSHAQVPLLHQLIYAYFPSQTQHVSIDNNVLGTSITPLPLPSTTPSSKNTTIAVLGDSMIDTLGPQIPSLKNALSILYPQHTFKILNYGVGSQTIESGLNRLSQSYEYKDIHFPPLLTNQPDLIIIESFAYNNFGNTPEGFTKYKTYLDLIIAKIKTELPQTKILLAATIAPNSTTFASTVPGTNFNSAEKIEKTQTIKKYLQAFSDYATNHKLPLADAYHPSIVNNDGNASYINPVDHIHPSPSGAAFFSGILADTIFKHQLI